MLMQPFLDNTHEPDCYNDRDDMALIAGSLDRDDVADQVPSGDDAVRDAEEAVDGVCVRDIPAVQESGVDHQKTDDCAEEQVAAKDTGR